MSSARYQCDRDVVVNVSYINTDAESFAVVSADGWSHMVLVDQPAASGARYAAPEPTESVKDLLRASYVWWTKDSEATLYHVDGDGKESLVLTCLQAP